MKIDFCKKTFKNSYLINKVRRSIMELIIFNSSELCVLVLLLKRYINVGSFNLLEMGDDHEFCSSNCGESKERIGLFACNEHH